MFIPLHNLTIRYDTTWDSLWHDLVFKAFFIQTDKKRQVDETEGRLWADAKGFHYFETSAQGGEGVNDMFQVRTMIKTIVNKILSYHSEI